MGKLTEAQRKALVKFDTNGGLREPYGFAEAFAYRRLRQLGLVERITYGHVGGIFDYFRITEAGRRALQQAFPIEKLPNVYTGAKPSDMLRISGAQVQQAIGACNEPEK